MPPERALHEPIHSFISAVNRRRWLLHLVVSVAVGAIAGLLTTAPGYVMGSSRPLPSVRWVSAVLAAALLMVLSRRLRGRRATAAAIEQAVPSCRNLVVTAEELERHPGLASAGMTHRIAAAADAALAGVGPGRVVPLYRILGALVMALAAIALTLPQGQQAVREAAATAARVLPAFGTAPRVRVRVEPPRYSGRPVATLDAPSRIEALEGSRLTFELRDTGAVRFGDTPVTGTVVARESGYFAVEGNGTGGERTMLIPLTVTRDRAPNVTIDAPGKDLLLTRGDRTIPVTIHAADDFALDNLELRYTKVSGTGEQFEFQEGTLPVRIERSSSQEWRAAGELALGGLRLGPGDSLVYRAVARDRRPGAAGAASSDTFFIEIAGPGQVALEGVDMPPELERYALSQQMIVLKIERLRAKAAGMQSATLMEEAAGIAAEQRSVRANFVFLLGGHVEDEEVEAEQSHEIQEGRLENTARKDINAAIGHMTRAGEGLTAVQLDAALPPARAAVEALQRAFGKSRYLLRSLAVRSRLDPSRRLTGSIEDARNWVRVPAQADARDGEAARRLLDRLFDLAASLKPGESPRRASLAELAEVALDIDSASSVWQNVAGRLLEAKDTRALEEVIASVAPEARRGGLPRTPLAEPVSPMSRAFRLERRP